MARKNRTDLKNTFSDGKRPNGTDFADLLDSFINPEDDSIKRDASGNFTITLGNVANAPAGTLRFNGGKVQVFEAGTWQDVGSGSGGGFQQVGTNIAFNGGNVGINTGITPPTTKLDINLVAGETIKVGNAGIGNGAAAQQTTAFFGHKDMVNNTNFGVAQNAQGSVQVNAPATQRIRLTKNGNSAVLTINENNNVLIRTEAEISPGAVLQVSGPAVRADGSANWGNPSDIRLKKEIQPFRDGLKQLLKINPVKFKYNGKANMQADKEQVGIIGQEIAEILPYTVSTLPVNLENKDSLTDVIVFDPNALIYVLVNSVKELAEKVQDLQMQLSVAKTN